MTEPAIATSDPVDTPAPAQRRGTPAAPAPAAPVAPAPTWLAFSALAWLLLSLLVNRTAFTPGSMDFNLALAAVALPGLVQASLVAGVAVSLFTTGWLDAHGKAPSTGVRFAAGIGAGLFAGAVATSAALLVFGVPAGAGGVLALTVGLAGALGGALGAWSSRPLLRAGVIAALSVMVLAFVAHRFADPLLRFFGDDGTPAGRYAANGWVAFTLSLVSGITAGLLAFWRLRALSRQAGQAPRWPVYLLAGGAAGLMLAVAELFTRLGAPWLLSMASTDMTGDQLFEHMAADSRLNTCLVVFFVGAITAMVAYGRTLPKVTPDA
ncbi:hypothetical protein QEZ54_06065 [Catellatospora sp. KI3]|uniref:hypothetical protein n=1 Tax=Catellatospora sp. KI3 TaxID=3041620 RepID=UPI00248295BF|nr:hypothetical protein [Catellatospora sp. KI3]MDI1460528.1 hypothetical protein [Catellatospora sp. KI3]